MIGCDRSLTSNCSNHLTAHNRNPLFCILIFLTPPVCLLVSAVATPGCERSERCRDNFPVFSFDTYAQMSLVSMISWSGLQEGFPCHSRFILCPSAFTVVVSAVVYFSSGNRWPLFHHGQDHLLKILQNLHRTTTASVCGSVLRCSTFALLFYVEQTAPSLSVSNFTGRDRERSKKQCQRSRGGLTVTRKGGCLDIQPPPNPRTATPTSPHTHPDPPSPEKGTTN